MFLNFTYCPLMSSIVERKFVIYGGIYDKMVYVNGRKILFEKSDCNEAIMGWGIELKVILYKKFVLSHDRMTIFSTIKFALITALIQHVYYRNLTLLVTPDLKGLGFTKRKETSTPPLLLLISLNEEILTS